MAEELGVVVGSGLLGLTSGSCHHRTLHRRQLRRVLLSHTAEREQPRTDRRVRTYRRLLYLQFMGTPLKAHGAVTCAYFGCPHFPAVACARSRTDGFAIQPEHIVATSCTLSGSPFNAQPIRRHFPYAVTLSGMCSSSTFNRSLQLAKQGGLLSLRHKERRITLDKSDPLFALVTEMRSD